MVMSIRTIHTRGRREAREWWDAATDDTRPLRQRRHAFRKFRQRIAMLPKGSMADIRVTQVQRDALERILELSPDQVAQERRVTARMLGVAFLLGCLAGLAYCVND